MIVELKKSPTGDTSFSFVTQTANYLPPCGFKGKDTRSTLKGT
jgi:hypothetical protein